MSFFGFDTNGPQSGQKEVYEFQDTYDGLGDQLDETDDAFNDETFGVTPQNIRKDFSFGDAPGQPQQQTQVPTTLYAAAAAQPINDDQFMEDLWGLSNAPKGKLPAAEGAGGDKKIMLLEEIEAQLTAIDPSQMPRVPQGAPPAPQGMAQGFMMPPPQMGYMMPPQGFIPGYGGQFVPGMQYQGVPMQMMPQMYGQPGQPGQPGQAAQPQMIPQGQPGQGQPQPQQPQQLHQLQPQQLQQANQSQAQTAPGQPISAPIAAQPVVQATQQPQLVAQPQSQEQQQQQPVLQQTAQPAAQAPADLSQFPVLGSKEAKPSIHQIQHHSVDDLTEEQQQKLAKRQEKVARIMKYLGIMNPKDKDFVTRFQLAQIVTEDPYNEDFYAQVFKVIHPKANSTGLPEDEHNSIAQAYLEQLGHRLGGRYKRADVALQRMQQQVQKAVTVAKERPKLSQYAKEGALGRISFGLGKKPRQQLELLSKAVQKQIEEEGEDKDQAQGELAFAEDGPAAPLVAQLKKERSTLMLAPRIPNKRYSKRDIMLILENIIAQLMNVELELRTLEKVDTTALWELLRVLEQLLLLGDEEAEVNPFIQCLNYNKMLKILLRLFKFLTREQVLTIVTLVMSNLENLNVVKNGSYTTYDDKKVPASVQKLVETYTMTFSKVLMNAVLDFKFNEIIGLLVILIEHNNVPFVLTTKIGLQVLTTLLSRAMLIIGDGRLSATELSLWQLCYDELFTLLELRIAAIFPPHLEGDDVDDNYIWQFLATLCCGGKLNHQRILVDEVRDEIFGTMKRAKELGSLPQDHYKKQALLNNLNMFLNVMGLVADENEIKEFQA